MLNAGCGVLTLVWDVFADDELSWPFNMQEPCTVCVQGPEGTRRWTGQQKASSCGGALWLQGRFHAPLGLGACGCRAVSELKAARRW